MVSLGWSLAEIATHLLERDEREAVLGDLSEADESAWHGLLDVLGLVIRRQLLLWKSWRPWLSAFGLTLPGSFLLMGASVSVSSTYQRIQGLMGPRFLDVPSLTMQDGLLLLCQVFLLIAWSWAGGFVVGSMSRRTLWASTILCCSPCLFCLARFRIESLSRLCLLLFLLPAILGVRQGVRIMRIKMGSAIVLAVAVTVLMIPTWSRGLWIFNCALMWPAWYIVAAARKPSRQTGCN
jgi:hypothetical protein